VVETLISEKNPLLKEVRRLATGGDPGEDRLALAEGPRLLDEALRSGIAIGAVILAESAKIKDENRLSATRVVRVPYTEGTLVVDLRDPSTRSLVWRGIASEEKSDGTKIQGKLDDMVRKAIEKYPPKPK